MPRLTLKTLLITAAIGGIAVPSMAQVTKVIEPVNVPTRIVDADFVIADINEDGSLDRDEFVSFVVIKSDAGQTEFRNVVTSGEFDKEFAVHDHDADGKITIAEMGHVANLGDKMEGKAKNPDAIWPETPVLTAPEIIPEISVPLIENGDADGDVEAE